MILFVLVFSKRLGGAERHVADLVDYFSKRHQVVLITRKKFPGEKNKGLFGYVKKLVASEVITSEVWPVFVKWQVKRLIAKYKPDVVHAHLGGAAKIVNGLKLNNSMATLHGVYNEKRYSNIKKIVCVSEWQKTTIPDSFKGDVVLSSNFVKPPSNSSSVDRRIELGISEDIFVVGAVGRMDRSKGFDVLLKAFLSCRQPGMALVIVGDGEMYEELSAMQSDNIFFVGWQSNVDSYYDIFDIYVCPSFSESFGLNIVEAMRFSLPVISTRTDGAMGFLDENNSILVNTGDVNAIEKAILKLYSDKELHDKLSIQSKKVSDKYKIDTVLPNIEKEYEELSLSCK